MKIQHYLKSLDCTKNMHIVLRFKDFKKNNNNLSTWPTTVGSSHSRKTTCVLCTVPSSVCCSSKTWFISLVFSSTSTWFSPEITNTCVTDIHVQHSVFLRSHDAACGPRLRKHSCVHPDVPSMSQFMVRGSSSCVEYRATDPLSAWKKRRKKKKQSISIRTSTQHWQCLKRQQRPLLLTENSRLLSFPQEAV